MTKVILGAPSLNGGKGANEAVTEAFAGAPFPQKLRFTNLVDFDQSYPEARLRVKGVGHAESSVIVEIKSEDALIRLSSSIQNLSIIWERGEFLEISDEIEDPADNAAPSAKTTKKEKGA